MYRGFVKDITNLSGRSLGGAELRVLNFNINRDILTKAVSTFTVVKVPEEARIGFVFGVYDDYGRIIYLGRISEIENNEITTDQIISIFDDNWLWNNPNLATIEETVRSILTTDFANNSDNLVSSIFNQFTYAINSPGTQLALPTQEDNYVENFMNFLFELYENYGLLLDIDIPYNPTTPTLTITKPNFPVLKLGNNNEVLINFNVQRDTYETNKLIVYSNDGETLRGVWYGSEKGITQDATSEYRLPKINTNIVFSDDPIEDIIADNLSEEMYNHKITVDLVLNNRLYDFNDFHLGQQFIIYYNDEIYESILTGYSISVDDFGMADIVNLVFGKVRISLTNKINSLLKGSAAFDSKSYLKKSGGTVAGDLGFTEGKDINLYDADGNLVESMTTNDLFNGGDSALQLQSLNDTTTSTDNNARTRTFKVSGNGVLSVSLSVFTDATTDTGSVYQYVRQNSNYIARGFNRISSAFNGQQGGNCAITFAVSDADTITLYNLCTKNGTKTYYWNILGINCTFTEQ